MIAMLGGMICLIKGHIRDESTKRKWYIDPPHEYAYTCPRCDFTFFWDNNESIIGMAWKFGAVLTWFAAIVLALLLYNLFSLLIFGAPCIEAVY